MSSIHDFSAVSIDGKPIDLSSYRDKVVLIVNTASQCGYTSQYEGLQSLYEKYSNRGLVVLGFPCNQFGQQEPGSAMEIQSFCVSRYGVSFPLFEKIDVNGSKAHPLYGYLCEADPEIQGQQAIQWNFTKFLVDKSGKVVKRYAPGAAPSAIASDIEPLLA
jgi:glutathione peroxidase